jgi:hypothetical protein
MAPPLPLIGTSTKNFRPDSHAQKEADREGDKDRAGFADTPKEGQL